MTPVYFDANALVKRYARELGSEHVGRIFETADDKFTCKVAFAEVMATLRKKRDEDGVDVDSLTNQFHDDWDAITTVDLVPELLVVIRQRAFQHSLKALDLLHLSAALLLRDEVRIPLVFVSSDQILLRAARQESFDVFDPEREDPARLES